MHISRTLLMLALITTSSYLPAMQERKMPLFPFAGFAKSGILDEIIIKLTLATRTSPRTTEEKIPAIVKDVKAFSLTNPVLYEAINTTHTTQVFANVLATQFNIRPFHITNNNIMHKIQKLDISFKLIIDAYHAHKKLLEESNFH